MCKRIKVWGENHGEGSGEKRRIERRKREEGVQKGGKERRTTFRVTSCRLPRVFSSSTFTLPPCSSPRLVSSPPPCPRKHPRTFFHPSRFVFFVEGGREGYPTRLDSSMVVPTYLAPLPILAKRFLEFEQDLPYFLPMIHRIYHSHSLSVSGETWRKSVYYLDVFLDKRFVCWNIQIEKKRNNYSTTTRLARWRNINFKDDRSRCLILRDERKMVEHLARFSRPARGQISRSKH